MKTLLAIIIFILIYRFLASFAGIFIFNIIGLPGSLIGAKSKSKKELKYIIGVIITLIGHLYLSISIMIYLISWTKLNVDIESYTKYLIWFFCMVATVGAFTKLYEDAKDEWLKYPTGFFNPQILSLRITKKVSILIFFIIIFFPEIFNPLWGWVFKIGYPI
ncbi:MAG: hypothetical protein Q8Q51_11515 [Lutibacter sp.]|nr:hypothetical protein [Lutibacter sp.]